MTISVGGIAQWQSIRLQIERSPVQLRLPPNRFVELDCTRMLNIFIAMLLDCILYRKAYIDTILEILHKK